MAHPMRKNYFPISIYPIIEGRTPTHWIMENYRKLTREEFYNQSLSEDDLKKIVELRELADNQITTEKSNVYKFWL
jgi:hypothetical protein